MKKSNLKDIIFIASVVLFSSILIFKGIAFANPIPCSEVNGQIVCEPSTPLIDDTNWLVNSFSNNPIIFAIIFNLIVDTVVFWIVSLLLKVKRSIGNYFVPIPFILIIGFLSDYISLLVDKGPVGFILVSLMMIFAGDYLVLRYITKLEWKKAVFISLTLAVLTNPFLWMVSFSIK